jgi:hypothetical protein
VTCVAGCGQASGRRQENHNRVIQPQTGFAYRRFRSSTAILAATFFKGKKLGTIVEWQTLRVAVLKRTGDGESAFRNVLSS